MTLGLKVLLGALVTYWVSSAFGWNFWIVAAVIGVLMLAKHFGWFGMTRTSVASTSSGVSAKMMKFVVGFTTLTFIMMVGTVIIGVSNNYAFSCFLALGPRPWLYPSGVPTDLLIWIALFFLSVVIAGLAANGRVKPAIWIFGLTLAFLFVARQMPRVAETARPKAATQMTVPTIIPPPTTRWEEADQAASEGRGIAPVVVDTAKKAVVGDHVAKRLGGGIRGTLGDFFEALFPSSPRPTPTPAGGPPTAQQAPPVVRQLPDQTAPCKMTIAEIRDLYTDGEPVFMLPPGWPRSKAIRYSGKGHLIVQGGNIRSGEWEFWSANDPKKVVLIRVFGK